MDKLATMEKIALHSKTYSSGIRGLIIIGLAALILVALSGCSLLKRGDMHRASEETAFIKAVEFKASDNTLSGLPNDIHVELDNNDRHIHINVPYITDVTQVMTLQYETVGSDSSIVVGLFTGADEDNPQSWEMAAFDGTFTFNTGTAPEELQLLAYHPGGLDTGEQLRVITIHLTKTFYPVLLNPYHPDIPNPMVLRIGFVDEQGNPIWTDPAAGEWYIDDPLPENEIYPEYDSGLLNFVSPVSGNDPTYQAAAISAENPIYTSLPAGFEVAVEALTPDDHWLFLPRDIYEDEHGYRCSGRDRLWNDDPYSPTGERLIFTYNPPPIYLSNRSGIPDDLQPDWGLVPEKPVPTWADARAILDVNPAIVDLFIEGSETPYDTDGLEAINTGTRPGFNIFGGFRPGFANRYPSDNDESHGHTFLIDSVQNTGTTYTTPDAVLQYEGITDIVLDRVVVVSVAGAADLHPSALVIRNNSAITVNDCVIVATEDDAVRPTALSLVSNPGLETRLQRTVIAGRPMGSSESYALYSDESEFNTSQVHVFSGESTHANGSVGIMATNNSQVDLNWSLVDGGRGLSLTSDSIRDDIIDAVTAGVVLQNSNIGMQQALIRAAEGATTSRALVASTSAGSSNWTFINDSTLVSGGGLVSSGVSITDNDSHSLRLFNTVILANTDGSSATDARGIDIAGLDSVKIMNNAIYTRRASGSPLQTVGILFPGTLPAVVQITNNLIWTRNMTDFRGIATATNDISGLSVEHNNIWSTDGNAGFFTGTDINAGDGNPDFDDVKSVQAGLANWYGNLSLDVDVITSWNRDDYFNSSHDRIGRVRDPVPDDIRFGGRDLGTDADFPDNGSAKKDRRWHDRNGNGDVYWSIGPYEIEDTAEPAYIYVSQGANADDSHPLGTREAPFASLARGYDAARSGTIRWDVFEIRVEAGDWDVGASGTPLPVMTQDVWLTGGWNSSFSSRSQGASVLFREDNAGPVVSINSVSPGFRLDGFTIESRMANSLGLEIDGASPTIVDNHIGADPTLNIPWKGVSYINSSTGDFEGNHINGAESSTDVVCLELIGSSPGIRHNSIDGGPGNPGTNIAVLLSAGSSPEIEQNTVIGGDTTSGDSTAISIEDTSGPSIYRNTIIGGAVPAGIDSFAIRMTGTGNLNLYNNTRIAGGDGGVSHCIAIENGWANIFDNPAIEIGNSLTGAAYGIEAGTDVNLSSNVIPGGSAATNIYGVYLAGAGTSSSLDHNMIQPGTGQNSYGIYAETGQFSIDEGSVSGGNGTTSSYGIYLNDTPSSNVSNVLIHGGVSAMTTGLHIVNSWSSIVENNQIFGGNSSGSSYGVNVVGPSILSVRNNFIHGGNAGGAEIRGLRVESATAQSRFYSNTVFGGNATGGNTAAIYAFDGQGHYINNIIIAGNGVDSANSMGFHQDNFSAPARFMNNLILGLSGTSAPYTDIGNTVFDTSVLIDGIDAVHTGNLVSMGESVTAYLHSFSASGTSSGFPGGDWHLTGGGSQNAVSGGYDLGSDDLVYDFTHDIDWGVRTVPWSIGADSF